VYISPKNGVELTWWSVGDGHPKPIAMPRYVDRRQYLIFYSYGTYKEPLELTIDVQVSQSIEPLSLSLLMLEVMEVEPLLGWLLQQSNLITIMHY